MVYGDICEFKELPFGQERPQDFGFNKEEKNDDESQTHDEFEGDGLDLVVRLHD